MRNWQWWKLFAKVKPLLNFAKDEEERKRKEEEYDKMKESLEKIEKVKKELEAQNVTLTEQKNDIYLQLQTQEDTMAELEERLEKFVSEKADFEAQIKEMEEKLLDEEDAAAELEDLKKKLTGENDLLKQDIEDLESSLAKVLHLSLFNSQATSVALKIVFLHWTINMLYAYKIYPFNAVLYSHLGSSRFFTVFVSVICGYCFVYIFEVHLRFYFMFHEYTGYLLIKPSSGEWIQTFLASFMFTFFLFFFNNLDMDK